MNVLLSAFECEPGRGSEAGVGWGVARSLAKRHRVHVLTAPRHRAAIERFFVTEPVPNLSFSYFDFGPRAMRLVVNSALWQIYYHAWQLRIETWSRPVVAAFAPDVIHHITYGRYWTPCPLWKTGRPLVWGPLGGGDFCPPPFLADLSWRERLTEKIRAAAQRLAEFDPQLPATVRHARVAIASTPATLTRLRALGSTRAVLLLQMALDAEFIRPLSATPATPSTEVMFCSIGRLLGWKGHSLALRAFAAANLPDARLIIAGDGPEKPALVKLAKALGLGGRVAFWGAVPRSEAQECLARATALVHPSLHDQAPTVVFEAMALGTPVIALDLGGLPLQLTAETGRLIAAHTPEQAVADIARALRWFAENPVQRNEMGRAAQRRVREFFTWEKKAEQFEEIYRTLVSAESSTPAGRVLTFSNADDAANQTADAQRRA